MKSSLIPYLAFHENARQAMEFYKTVFGGTLEISTFGESSEAPDTEHNDLVMHSMLEAENGITFMATDKAKTYDFTRGNAMSMSLSGDNDDELRGYFDKLSENGTVTMPLEAAPWGDTFGMLIDQYGIEWMVNISADAAV
jgi:PhnB protein